MKYKVFWKLHPKLNLLQDIFLTDTNYEVFISNYFFIKLTHLNEMNDYCDACAAGNVNQSVWKFLENISLKIF